jgi:uncharacterized protein (TIGR02996 family)
LKNSNLHSNFLRAILDAPNDDLPRLVYADYLEETGEADRAEFIRIQCELAAGCEKSERKKALESRQAELLAKYSDVWRLPIRGPQTFRRGFVDSLWTSADVLLASEPEWLVSSLVRTLRITNADKHVDDLAEYRGFKNIEHLDLTNNNLSGDYRLRAVLGNSHLAKLKGLNLHNNRIWADDVLRLSQSPLAKRLTHLDLSGNGIGNEGVAHLVDEEAFANLEVLNLRSDGLPEYECISRSTLPKLVYRSKKLRSLDLAGHHLGDEDDFATLMHATLRSTIEQLDVSANHIDENSLRDILVSQFNNIAFRSFNFSRNQLSFADVECLLIWEHLKLMDEFRLTDCKMDDETIRLLLDSPHAAKFHLNGYTP